MAIVSKNDQTPESGDGSPKPGEPQPTQPRRHNLPLKAAPVVGRRPEMQRVVSIFEKIRREGRPRRVEVVGRLGVGASTVAVELARRAGHRFPGGAWYVNLSMGPDVAWATLDALRGDGRVKDLAGSARRARERLGEEPKSLLVVDGAGSADEVRAALPPESEAGADVFVVAEEPLGTVDAEQVCRVSDVPRHGARRIAHAMARHGQPDAKPPSVRTLDGLALTAGLAARCALAYQGKEGPLSFDDPAQAMQRLVRLVAGHGTALEMLLIASVAHPTWLPIDALFGAIAHVRKGRGKQPAEDELGTGLTWLAHAGIFEPLDESHVAVHPLVQRVVHGMAQSPADLAVARQALAEGLVADAEAAIAPEGVDLGKAAIHQLRHVAATADAETRLRVAGTVGRLERALGVAAA